jgi:hypothetical protein
LDPPRQTRRHRHRTLAAQATHTNDKIKCQQQQ